MSDTPLYSKRHVDRASRALRRHLAGEEPPLSDDEFKAASSVVEAFRASHSTPMMKARMGLRSCIKTEGLEAVEVTQRLKRTPTIVDKLRRLPTMKLSSMQDIGGCRAVFWTQAEVERVQERFMHNSAKRNGIEDTVRDYVANPRSSGYRAVHVWTRYDDRRIEVQLRTALQHAWADGVEALTSFAGIDYKNGAGPDVVHEWLCRESDALAYIDAGGSRDEAYGPGYAGLHKAAWEQVLSSARWHRGGIHG